MTNDLDIKRVCLLVRPGIEIWLDNEKAEILKNDLISGEVGKFIKLEGRLINTADIAGIFEPIEMEEYRRHSRGQWRCKLNNWHNKTEMCYCIPPKKETNSEEIIKQGSPEVIKALDLERIKILESLKIIP